MYKRQTQPFAKARVVLTANGIPLYGHVGGLSPVEVLEASVPVDVPETALTLTVYAASGRKMCIRDRVLLFLQSRERGRNHPL